MRRIRAFDTFRESVLVFSDNLLYIHVPKIAGMAVSALGASRTYYPEGGDSCVAGEAENSAARDNLSQLERYAALIAIVLNPLLLEPLVFEKFQALFNRGAHTKAPFTNDGSTSKR